jgi:hypothetical protein
MKKEPKNTCDVIVLTSVAEPEPNSQSRIILVDPQRGAAPASKLMFNIGLSKIKL